MNARIELKNLNRDPVEGRLEIDVDPGSVDLAGFLLEGRNEFRADLRFADDVLTLAGTARSGAVSAVNRRATQVDATFELHHRTLTFQPLEFVLHRGQVRKTGRIEFVPDDDPRFDIALQLTDMDVIEATDTDIFDTTKTNRPRLSGEAQLRGVWTRVENFYSKIGAETFGGNGRLEIRGGIILSQDLLSAMANLIPGEVLRSALRTEAAPRNQPIELEFLRGSFVIEDAVIRTDDTELRSDAYHATAAGSGTLDGRLKLDAEVSLTSNGLKRTLALARVVSEDSPNPPPDYPPITVHVSGSLDNLEYHPEIDDVRVAVTVVPLAVGTAIDAGQRIYHRTGRVIESGQDWIRSGSGEDAESETETNADPPSQ
jgi:hypothetical protein